jgi:spore photoproduct lyase
MAATADYAARFATAAPQTLFWRLDGEEQAFIRALAGDLRFTLQELRQVCEAAVDLAAWGEPPLRTWWPAALAASGPASGRAKDQGLDRLRQHLVRLRSQVPAYPAGGLTPPARAVPRLRLEREPRVLVGRCPCASPQVVCCGLMTLDAVRGCGFACSYCTIQTFYAGKVVFDPDLAQGLADLRLPPGHVHLGTGQASDGLMWGNRHDLLTTLCAFARARPEVLLELRTKAANIAPLLRANPPPNLFPSWSLNPPALAAGEEHRAAPPAARLRAARRAADAGLKVAFHLHPLMLFTGWEAAYTDLAQELVNTFDADEVAYVSMGTVAFIKPVLQAIRRRGGQTRVLQPDYVVGPHGKLTYPEATRVRLYRLLSDALIPWRGRVYQSLCLEPGSVWQAVLGVAGMDSTRFAAASVANLRAKLCV